MPIIKSAKKRVKIAAKANARNTRTRRSMREAIKALNAALESGKSADIIKTQKEAMSVIDVAAKKAVIHKNKAARKKSQIAAKIKAKGVKPSPKSKVQSRKPKPAAKKTPVKRTATKETSAKKATKKPA